MKKFLSLLLVAVMLYGVVVASVFAADEKVVINVGVGSFAATTVYSAKEQFEASNPNVEINVIEIPFGSLYEKLKPCRL